MSFVRQFLGLSIWIRILIIFALLWGFTAFLFVSKLNNSENETTYKRINKAISYLEQTKQKHEELKTLIDEYLRQSNQIRFNQLFMISNNFFFLFLVIILIILMKSKGCQKNLKQNMSTRHLIQVNQLMNISIYYVEYVQILMNYGIMSMQN